MSRQPTHNLNTYNCSDFGLDIMESVGLSLPNTAGVWPGGGGRNPGDLGEDIRALTPPSNVSITTTFGNAFSNSGTCN